MPSPRKSSRSPARTRGRPPSASRSKATTARSRSRSSGRKPKSVVSETHRAEEAKVVIKKLPPRNTRKSPSRAISEENTVIKRTVTSAIFSSAVSSSTSSSRSSSVQEQAFIAPTRISSALAAIIEKEKQESLRQKEQLKSELLSLISTPLPRVDPKTENKGPYYEFMGPFGAFFIFIFMHTALFYTNVACSENKLFLDISSFSKSHLASLFEVEAMLILLAWFFFQAILAVLPVGHVVEGQPLKDGVRLKYRCNGLFALTVSLLLLGVAVYFQFDVTIVIDKFYKLMTSAVIFSFILSIFLYISSRFVSDKKLSPSGSTGNIIYDFFVGHELNPRIGMLDLKLFFELRPGMIGWIVLDWIMVIKAYQETTTFPPNLVLVTAFQTLYVIDAFWFEDTFLTTMEIVHDGFGFMLAFGSIAWMPFFYSLQPRFLLEHSFTLPWYCLAPIALLHFVGFYIYRLSSLQKYRFRNGQNQPTDSGVKSLPTQKNGRLLTSGWWGICRKPNFLGDLIIALSWSLATGFVQIVTYFYPIYLLVYLIHRERRDSEKCRKKYGASWDCYCDQVRYRIFPLIY